MPEAKPKMNCPDCKIRSASFGKHRNGLRRFRCGQCGKTYTEVFGNPEPNRICTSIVERQNLTIRMQIRRLTRLTNAFSTK